MNVELLMPAVVVTVSMLLCLLAFLFVATEGDLHDSIVMAMEEEARRKAGSVEEAAADKTPGFIHKLIGNAIRQRKPYFEYRWEYNKTPWKKRTPEARIQTVFNLIILFFSLVIAWYYFIGNIKLAYPQLQLHYEPYSKN